MKDESRLILVSGKNSNVQEWKISKIKLSVIISFILVAVTLFGKFGMDLLIDFSHNSKIKRLERTNTVLQSRLTEVQSKIKDLTKQMDQIIAMDDNLRTVIGLEEVSSDIRDVGVGGSNYEYVQHDEISGFNENVKLSQQLTELSKLEREIKLELDSYNELLSTFNKKQDSLSHFPALKPVLHGVISSRFGMRRHPVFRVRRHHDGLDFSAKVGTPVVASADGVVKFARKFGGLGKTVMIDHLYGYETRYGHLNKIVVRVGQRIKRGEKIGEVGSSGISTAPHLHWEVRYKNKPLNPDTFYFDDIILNERVVSSTE
jgi:murein DD-endopeptidase MepM/ murein hydrolase activator NlpD